MTVGRLFGARVTLSRGFLLVVALFGFAGMLVDALVLFAAVFLHELGHALAARRAGLEVAEVELLPFGGVARVDGLIDHSPAVEVAVALAGPLVNALLIGAWLLAGRFAPLPEEFGRQFLQANALIGGFNLAPALPLDGGRIVRALLSRGIGYRRATKVAARLGRVVSVLLALAGAGLLLAGRGSAASVLVPAFVFARAGREEAQSAYAFVRHLARRRSEYAGARARPCRHIAAPEEARLKEVLWEFVPQRYHLVWVVSKEGRLKAVASEGDVIDAVFERGIHEPVVNVARPL